MARPARGAGGLADRAQPVERARLGELGSAQAIDEVATPDPPGFLHGPEHRIDRREPAGDRLGGDRLAGQDPVPFEQREGEGVEALRPGRGSRAAGLRPRSTSDQRPAASGGPSAVSRPGRGRAVERAGRRQRSARSGANVSFVTSPAHTRSHSASRTSRSWPPPVATYSSR